MRINLATIKGSQFKHKYVTHVVINEREITKLIEQLELLKLFVTSDNFGPNIYIPCNAEQAKIVAKLSEVDMAEVEYTEN